MSIVRIINILDILVLVVCLFVDGVGLVIKIGDYRHFAVNDFMIISYFTSYSFTYCKYGIYRDQLDNCRWIWYSYGSVFNY